MGKLDVLEFVDLRQKLKENYIDWCSPVCCDARQSNYSFLRAQMQGAFEFSREEGVWIKGRRARRKMPQSVAPGKGPKL